MRQKRQIRKVKELVSIVAMLLNLILMGKFNPVNAQERIKGELWDLSQQYLEVNNEFHRMDRLIGKDAQAQRKIAERKKRFKEELGRISGRWQELTGITLEDWNVWDKKVEGVPSVYPSVPNVSCPIRGKSLIVYSKRAAQVAEHLSQLEGMIKKARQEESYWACHGHEGPAREARVKADKLERRLREESEKAFVRY